MYPHTHFIFGLLLAILGIRLNIINIPLGAALVLFSVLIDLDHLAGSLSVNPRKIWNNLVQGGDESKIYFMHSYLGFVIVTLIIFLLYFIDIRWMYVLGTAYYFHLSLDSFNRLITKETRTKKLFGFTFMLPPYYFLADLVGIVGIILFLTI